MKAFIVAIFALVTVTQAQELLYCFSELTTNSVNGHIGAGCLATTNGVYAFERRVNGNYTVIATSTNAIGSNLIFLDCTPTNVPAEYRLRVSPLLGHK